MLIAEIERVWRANLQVYGADKVWRQLNREGIEVARGALRAFRGLRAAEADNFGLVTQDAAFGFIKQLKFPFTWKG